LECAPPEVLDVKARLSKAGFDNACRFIRSHGRPLDAALLSCQLFDGARDAVIREVARYQNADGGFGNALEPDLRTPASTGIATAVGLRLLREVEAPSSNAVVAGAIRYLIDSIDPQAFVWPIITEEADLAAHAPWWSYSDDLGGSWNGFRFNPTAEALAYLYEYRDLVPAAFLDELTDAFMGSLRDTDVIESYYEIQCCCQLHRTHGLDASLRALLAERLRSSLLELDPDNEHTNYFKLSPSPDDFIYPLVEEHYQRSVARAIEERDASGCWNPWWDWSEVDAHEWSKARVEWQGVRTRIILTSAQPRRDRRSRLALLRVEPHAQRAVAAVVLLSELDLRGHLERAPLEQRGEYGGPVDGLERAAHLDAHPIDELAARACALVRCEIGPFARHRVAERFAERLAGHEDPREARAQSAPDQIRDRAAALACLPARAFFPTGRGHGVESAIAMGATRVRDIMSDHIVTISSDDSLSTVEDIMTLGHVRHMPVVRAGQLVGVVSERDLLRASLSNLSAFGSEQRRAFLQVVEIKRVMSTPPIVIDPDASVEDAALVMAERKIGCLPVVEGGRLIGMLTETDVLRYFAGVPR
jgi:CBS domain-containing protein